MKLDLETHMQTNTGNTAVEQSARSFVRRRPAVRISRGGIDEINTEDIIYGLRGRFS